MNARSTMKGLALRVAVFGFCAAVAGAQTNEADWWSFKPATRPVVPSQKGNPAGRENPIDAFVAAKLQANGLSLSPEADRRTLIRRLTFNLIGLPPTPEEVADFLGDPSTNAYARVVDRLLASPRYGERWARHWLDVVHYGESHGYDKDKPRPNAWPYRDYVIRSFNSDKPYSRFVEEQLAADALFPDQPEAIPALGFIAAGPWDFVGHVELPITKTDGLIARYNDRDDMVMNAMSTFQSLTVHCARCHDHKFDPITQREYYGLQAVFAGVDRADRAFDSDPQVARRREELKARLRAATDTNVIQEIKAHLAALPKPRRVYAAASDFPPNGSFVPPREPRAVHLLKRGDVKRPAEEMTPSALRAVTGPPSALTIADLKNEGERRATLAQWLTHTNNLLARRSIVNRVWHYHFGRGIVDTPNDFGRMGALPTHPELLDWLAFWFLENGESFKKLHRLIVTSAVYRQSSTEANEGNKVLKEKDSSSLSSFASVHPDSQNKFLWRMNRARLDAEQVRDAILATSGQLDLAMGGPSVQQFHFKDDHSPVYDYARYNLDDAGANRRSIYRFIVRSVPDPLMDALDCPDANLLTPARTVTTTALQALAMLNDAFVIRQCEHFAARLERERSSVEEQIARAYELALSRRPSAPEQSRLAAHARRHGLASACRVIFNSNEFMFVD